MTKPTLSHAPLPLHEPYYAEIRTNATLQLVGRAGSEATGNAEPVSQPTAALRLHLTPALPPAPASAPYPMRYDRTMFVDTDQDMYQALHPSLTTPPLAPCCTV